MSQDDLYGAPAGWYPDPLGLPQLRWWNNHAWTEQTSAARQPMVVQDTKFAWADDDLPTRRDERLRERNDFSATPPSSAPTAEALRELEPPRAFTQVGQGAATSAPTPAPTPTAAPSFPTIRESFMASSAAPSVPLVTESFSAEPVAPTVTPITESFVAPPPMQPSPRVESFYTPDPIVDIPAEDAPVQTLATIFDARPMDAPQEALNALFGEPALRRAGTRVKTPIVTIDQLASTESPSASKVSATGPSWVMAMIPLFQVVVSILVLNSLGQAGSQFVYWGVLVLPFFIAIALAYVDHGMLARAGHSKPAHWGWAFAGAPVYLLMRARAVIAETGHGIGPVLAWFGLGVLHLASFVAVPGVLIALLPAVFTSQIEQSVAHDAMLIASQEMTVTCQAAPPVLPGETITCQSVTGARQSDIVVTLVRSNGWIGWQVIDWGTVR